MPRVEFEIEGTQYEPLRLQGTVEISRLFELRAEVVSQGEAEALLGKNFRLTLHNDAEESWTLTGVVFGVERRLEGEGTALELDLVPDAARLTLGLNARVFQDLDVTGIIQQVLDDAAVASYEVRAAGTYPVRPYVVQYEESDWEFVERIAAEAGLYYYFEFTDEETKLVFADSSPDASPVAGDPAFPEVDPSGMLHDAASITTLQASWSSTSDSARVVDYNYEKPQLGLEGEAQAGGNAHEIYDYTGRAKEPDEATAAATLLLEASSTERLVVSGRSTCLRLHPGFTFEIASAYHEGLVGSYLLRRVELLVVEHTSDRDTASRSDAGEGVSVTFIAQPLATPFRAPARNRMRSMPGPQTGVVCGPSGSELHTSDTGLIRVQPYWDREGERNETSTTWMRTGQSALGGSMVLPRIGWDVLVEYHHDDVDQPFVSGHLYDGEHPTPYSLPENKTRTSWQTATTPGDGTASEIRFEDKAGSEEIFVNATKDMTVTVGDSSSGKVGANHTHDVGANRTLSVGSNSQNAVTNDQTMTIGASESCTISGNRECTVGGSESASIGGSRSATITMGSTIEATGGRTLCVGGSMLGASGLAVSRATMGTCSISVGGSWIMAAATGVANATAGASSETVGGAKIQAAGGAVSVSTVGAMAQNIGGACISVAGGDAGETSGGPLVINVGGAFVAAGPKVYLKADSKITIRAGGASLTMTSSKVKISAPSLASPGATIAKTGSTVKHN